MSKQADHTGIITEIKNGSDEALKEVYVKNRSRFLKFARKRGLSQEDALDVYQDTYIVFQDNIQSGRLMALTSSVYTYMIGIGKRIMMHKFRDNQKKVRLLSFGPVLDIDDQLDQYDIVLDELTNQQAILRDQFKLLSTACKQILTWFYYERYSFKKIVELGNYANENSAKSQKSRCLKSLKKSIDKSALYEI